MKIKNIIANSIAGILALIGFVVDDPTAGLLAIVIILAFKD